jgi:cytochrome c-type biogenesis protein CcmH
MRLHGSGRPALLALFLLLLAVPASAVIETYEFSDAALEKRYHRLSQELRCPKCQNQNIADSNAPISQDLRQLLFEQLEAGASDEEILKDMVARYGEFVRYRPAAEGAALWLWLAPVLLLIGGTLLVAVLFRRWREPAAGVSEEERERLAALLDATDSDPDAAAPAASGEAPGRAP